MNLVIYNINFFHILMGCAFWKIHYLFKCGLLFSGLIYIHCDITPMYGADEDEGDEENYFIMMMATL